MELLLDPLLEEVAAAPASPKTCNPALRPPLAKCKEQSSRASVSATVKARRSIVFAFVFVPLVKEGRRDRKGEVGEPDEDEIEACFWSSGCKDKNCVTRSTHSWIACRAVEVLERGQRWKLWPCFMVVREVCRVFAMQTKGSG
jgi:hypothetical protein